MGQLPVAIANDVSQGVLASLGHAGISSQGVIRALLEAPVEDFLTRISPGLPLFPVIDGDIIRKEVNVASLGDQGDSIFPGAKRVDSILVVNSQLDVSPYNETPRMFLIQ